MVPKRSSRITPSQLVKASKCRHYFALEWSGDAQLKRGELDGERLTKQEGLAYQERVARKILGRGQRPAKFSDSQEGIELTKKWMADGVEWIYQGFLGGSGLLGVPDLLKRIKRESLLGEYSYEPIDIKNRKQVNQSDRLQLFFYSYLLESTLGYRPRKGGVWLNGGVIREVLLDSKLEFRFHQVLDEMRKIQTGELKTDAERCSACGSCSWIDHCTQTWINRDHVSLLSGVGTELVRKFERVGIKTCREVASCEPDFLVERIDIKPKVADRLILSAQSRSQNKPILLRKPQFPKDMPIYFYDIETCDSRVFIHGIVRSYKGHRDEKFFFSTHPREEKRRWHEFLDYLAQDEEAIVYCWTNYERQFVQTLWDRYKGNAAGYAHLRDRLHDQCAFVRDHFALPCRGYSIKVVAPIFGFKWHVENANGMNCVAWYRKWTDTKDRAVKEKIIEYNLDDVRAMEVIDHELRHYQNDVPRES